MWIHVASSFDQRIGDLCCLIHMQGFEVVQLVVDVQHCLQVTIFLWTYVSHVIIVK